jgi:hypothetical protein
MFAKWKVYFKSKMKDEEWGVVNIVLWQAVLNEFNVTEDELIAGTTKACFARELNGWPPTTATDFINMVRGDEVSEYPDIKDAYTRAANSKFKKHVVIYETAKRVGFWELKTQPEHISYKRWQQHYPIVCSEHAKGTTFVIPESRQVAYDHTPVQAGSAFNNELNDFFAKHGSKSRLQEQI